MHVCTHIHPRCCYYLEEHPALLRDGERLLDERLGQGLLIGDLMGVCVCFILWGRVRLMNMMTESLVHTHAHQMSKKTTNKATNKA
jgi:hypothetical protein